MILLALVLVCVALENGMLKFPYGNSNFYQVSAEGFFYIDRTQCILQIPNLVTRQFYSHPIHTLA
jgi:hypothetical protein